MRQNLGQHFLKNQNAIRAMVRALEPGNELVIEIGPGKGALTRPLSDALQGAGGKLIAIEKDSGLAEEARNWGLPNLEIIEGDVLKILPDLIRKLKPVSYKLIGNIPYYLTGFLLRTIGELEPRPEFTVLTIQKEVAERLTASPPEMNRLAASVRFWASPKIIQNISRKDFSPPPKVDSATIALLPAERSGKISSENYYETLRKLFSQPRKTIANNLLGKTKGNRSESLENLGQKLAKIGVDPKSRPQNLSLQNIIDISLLALDASPSEK